MLADNTKQPVEPWNDVTEPEFKRFWMSKLDYKQRFFKRLPLGETLHLETLIKIAESAIITERLNIAV